MPLIDPGQKAPPFSLKDQDGQQRSLEDVAGRPLVLYFYPKDETSGCTKEACAFRDLMPEFGKLDCEVWGVSPDDEESHRKFVANHELNFPLLADTERDEEGKPAVCSKYGVWVEKSMYGRKYMGVERTTYLIGPDGTVARRWDKVKVPQHADEVLETLGQLA